MRIFNQSSFKILENALDAATLRQQVISNNVANVDTPHFKRSEVRFEELLKQEIQSRTMEGYRTHERHIEINAPGTQSIKPKVVQDHSTQQNNNRNNVDIDFEMARLAQNQLVHQALVDRMNGRFSSLRTVIGGGQ